MMMQVMREKTQGIFAIVVAVLIAVSFALFGAQYYLRTDNKNAAIAKVNGKKITQVQLDAAYEQFKHSEMFKFGKDFSFDQKIQEQFKKIILQQLIKTEVSHQAVAKMGLNIGKDQLWADINKMPIFQVDGKFSLDHFKLVTQRVFHSQAAFLKELKDSFLQQQLQKSIEESAFVLSYEVKQVEQLFKQRRDFNYFLINPEIFAQDVVIKDADIKNYYEQHKEEFTTVEKVSLQYIELSSDLFKNQIKPTQEQLEQYYQSHLNSFSKPKKWQVTTVTLPSSESSKKQLEQIKPADDLNKIANAKISTVWIIKNELGADFAAQLDKLGIGQLSKPFKTKDGIVISKVLAIQESEVDSYQKVAAKVKVEFEHQQLAQIFSEANDKLADLTYMNSDSLAVAAKEFGLIVQATDLIAQNDSGLGILSNKKVMQAAFSDSVLKQGYNSVPIEVTPGKLIVLRLKEHIPQAVKSLDIVKAEIILKLKVAAEHKKAEEFSRKILEQLRQGKSLVDISKPYSLTWQVMNNVKYDDLGVSRELTESLFALNKPSANKPELTSAALNKGYVIAQLTKVYDVSVPDQDKKEAEFIKSLADKLGQFEFKLLTNEWTKKAKVVTII